MRRAPLLSPALLLAGCATSHPPVPELPLPPTRAPTTLAPVSGPAQAIIVGAQPPAQWWRTFGSAKLDALVEAALVHNADLATAEASLRQAAEQARATAGSTGPQIDANYQAERVRVSRAFSNPLSDDPNQYIYTLHTAQVTVAYPLDLFGGGRAKVRSARAAAEVAADRLDAARTTSIADLVNAVIQHAALLDQIAAAERAAVSNHEILTLLQRRQALGDVGEADVATQQTALANAEAALPPLQRQAEHQAALIGSLTGVPAGSSPPPLPGFDELKLPDHIPVSLPADIVSNRPDVRAAEAQLKGAAADLKAAVAARLPAIQITGNAGGAATHFLDMFATGNPFYAVIGGITQPLFHSGQLLHQQRAAEAALTGAGTQYRAAALQAFLDVDDALTALRTDADALDAAARADTAARRTFELTHRQVELGAQGTLALLNASAATAAAESQRVQAAAARMTDSVALFQAIGSPTIPGGG